MHASLCRFELLPLIDLGSSDKPKPLSKVSCGIPLIFSCFLLHVKKKKQNSWHTDNTANIQLLGNPTLHVQNPACDSSSTW